MVKIKIFLFAGVVCLVCVTNCLAQFKPMEESQVPLRVQTFFYAKYNNPSNVKWSNLENIGEERFMVEFDQSGTDMVAVYNSAGKIQEEVSIDKKTNIDEDLVMSSLEKYPDGKVLKGMKVTKFNLKENNEPQSYYEVSVKVGKETIVMYFDGDKQPLPKDNVFNLAVN